MQILEYGDMGWDFPIVNVVNDHSSTRVRSEWSQLTKGHTPRVKI